MGKLVTHCSNCHACRRRESEISVPSWHRPLRWHRPSWEMASTVFNGNDRSEKWHRPFQMATTVYEREICVGDTIVRWNKLGRDKKYMYIFTLKLYKTGPLLTALKSIIWTESNRISSEENENQRGAVLVFITKQMLLNGSVRRQWLHLFEQKENLIIGHLIVRSCKRNRVFINKDVWVYLLWSFSREGLNWRNKSL